MGNPKIGSGVPTLPAIPSPSLQEYLYAASYAYRDNGEGLSKDTVPPPSTGLAVLLDSDKINAHWLADGFFGQAFADASGNVIISFEGTGTDSSIYATGSQSADRAISLGQTPPAFTDAEAFAQAVQVMFGSRPIYLTGHSLGGAEAEYVASRDHLSGVTFAAPGTLAPSYNDPVPGQSFVNYVDWGDPIGNFGFHFGSVQKVGPETDATIPFPDNLQTHMLAHYASDLSLQLGIA
jgi:hypothetical protein